MGTQDSYYIKLVNELSASKWSGFNRALETSQSIQDQLDEYRPVERWTDDPEQYFIMGSDPAEPTS